MIFLAGRVLDEKMFSEQSRLFGVTCSVKQLQQSQISKRKLEGKLDKIRKRDKVTERFACSGNVPVGK